MAHASSDPAIWFSQLPDITGGEIVRFDTDTVITDLVLDSRKATLSKGRLFLAIQGDRHDGHDYIHELYHQGVRHFAVEKILPGWEQLVGLNLLLVRSGVIALQRITAYHRAHYTIPVIGITGSNGKTIIKEWLFQLLSRTETVVKNPGSYNSQIGVPLSVWQIADHHSLGIFEAGISKPNEMAPLREIIRPTIGLFTNIGSAHNEGFHDETEKIREKMQLFTGVQMLIYCRDHEAIFRAISESSIPSTSWGFSAESDIHVTKAGTLYSLRWNARHLSFDIPFGDKASVENCIHCIAILLYLGHDPEDINRGIKGLRAVPMRLELKEGINQSWIVDDTYNNDLAGIEISLQFLSHQRQRNKKTVILSDVLESGLKDKSLAEKISAALKNYNIDRFIGIGPVLSKHKDLLPAGSTTYATTEEFLSRLDHSSFSDEVILVKGARVFGFERLAKTLQRKVHGTIMEIDLGAIVHNFNYIKSRLDRPTKVMVMVKAFAYGSGSNEVANLLQYHQADYLGVAYADEGVELRKNNITLPVMVMNPAEETFDLLTRYNLEPEIYSFPLLKDLIRFLKGNRCHVHIKLDTGMHRLGFDEQEIGALTDMLIANRNITVASIFSHLAGADEPTHDAFSREQAVTFLRCADALSRALGYKPLYHLLNSPGILRLPEYQFDMVRLGIGLYGVDPTGNETVSLRPAASLKTVISQIKHIAKNETVGYGRRGFASEKTTVATIAIGYADGFSRAFSRGAGKVLIKGKLAPVIGNVCMDMTMVDISGIDATEGDEVVIYGKDLSIETVAKCIGTIPYEILTNTSGRVKRVFTAESL